MKKNPLHFLLGFVLGVGILFIMGADVQSLFVTQITGGDEVHVADVVNVGGEKQLAVKATINIEELLGKFVFAQSFFTITTTGAIGSTIRVEIADDSIDVTSTVTASESGDPIEFAKLVVSDLNADSNFNAVFFAIKGESDSRVFIVALLPGPSGERADVGDLVVTFTGSTGVLDDDQILQGMKPLALFPNRKDRDIGNINVQGTIFSIPAGVSKRFFSFMENGGSSNLRVDGSSTPVTFTVQPQNSADEAIVTQIRCYGGGTSIKYGQFLSIPSSLTNGIEIEIQSEEEIFTFSLIKNTEDWKNLFAVPGGDDFQLSFQAGADQFIAIFDPGVPIPLKKLGTFTTDDSITVKIQDDLTGTQLKQLECAVLGFLQTG